MKQQRQIIKITSPPNNDDLPAVVKVTLLTRSEGLGNRVSEIAFEIGFQSLTNFNRRFKNLAGQSPTEYRRHLFTNLEQGNERKCTLTPASARKQFHPYSNRSTTTHRHENSTMSSVPILERNSHYAF